MSEIERIEVIPYAIPFRRPFVTAETTFTVRRGALLRIVDREGYSGIGEVAPHPAAPPDALDTSVAALRALRPIELGSTPRLDLPVPARIALETATLDHAARQRRVPLATLLGRPRRREIPLNATISAGSDRLCAAAARAATARGFECIKLKLDLRAPRLDETLREVREAVGRDVALRVDLNGADSADECIARLRRWAPLELQYVEQPVPRISDLARIRRAVPVPIAADESVTGVDAVDEIARNGAADVIVIKPSLVGLRVAVEIADLAHRVGLDTVVTSVLETSVGIAAAAHVAAVVPGTLLACGLATADLLKEDTVNAPLPIDGGVLRLNDEPGLGISVNR